jgi:hypothetical protein
MTTTTISRLLLDHPDLGTTGGAALHAAITALYTKIGDNIDTRYLPALALASGASVNLVHNFKTVFSDLRYDIYILNTGTGALTRVTSTSTPPKSQFTVVAQTGAVTTALTLTNNSGAVRDLVMLVNEDPIELGELVDIDLTTGPQDGQALVYDATAARWKSGASGDASFKLQAVATPNATFKGGYFLLDDGRELGSWDGSGTTSTGYGVDLVVSLTTLLGAAPANATTYYVYIDLLSLAAPVTLTDTGRRLYGVTSANLYVNQALPTAVERRRYLPFAVVRSATTGTAWSGAGSYFSGIGSSSKNTVDNTTPIKTLVTQTAHGFTSSNLGAAVYLNASGVYVLAKADAANTAEVVGLIESLVDVNRFFLLEVGDVTASSIVNGGSAFVVGTVYYVSAATAGQLTAVEPTVIGQVSKPVAIAKSTSVLTFINMRGQIVGSANFRTVLSLANNATTTVQDVSTYQAGEISGWIDLQATTPLKFLVQAQFAKNGAATNFNIAYQTVGDTPPAGFSVSITSAGLIQIALPSVAGFASCTVNYALNAPAVGATLPLAISGKLLAEAKNLTAVTATGTLAVDASALVTVNAAGATTQTLGSAVGVDGTIIRIKNIGAGVATIAAFSGQTIDGAASVVLNQNDNIGLIASGGNWLVLAPNRASTTQAGTLKPGVQNAAVSNTNAFNYMIAGGALSGISTTIASAGGDYQFVTINITGKFSNGNGTALSPRVAVSFLDGATSLLNKTFSWIVPSGYNELFSFTLSGIVPSPAAANYTITISDTEADGGGHTYYDVYLSASASKLVI